MQGLWDLMSGGVGERLERERERSGLGVEGVWEGLERRRERWESVGGEGGRERSAMRRDWRRGGERVEWVMEGGREVTVLERQRGIPEVSCSISFPLSSVLFLEPERSILRWWRKNVDN